MRKIVFSLIFVSTVFCSTGQHRKGYEIDVNISELKDSIIYLAYHLGDKQYIKDTIGLDQNGQGKFLGQEELPQGIYMIVLPGMRYFEILISTDQHFSVTCSYPDYFNTLIFSGSDENTAFINYQKNWIEMQKKASDINKRIQAVKQNSDSLRILSEMRRNQEESMKSYLRKVMNENNGNLLAALSKAMLPIDVPPLTVPEGNVNPDSVKWILSYLYNKDHFFDNIDLTDERLIRTPLLQARLNTFFTKIVIQSPDSINKEIDRIISKVKGNNKVFQFVAVYLFNHFRESEIMGHDAVLVKLADDIYLSGKADWVSDEFREDLRKQVDRMRPNLIGSKAHDLIMDSYKKIFVSLYDIEKDYTILYFWEPDCGHCAEVTPKLKDYYEKTRNSGVEIFAVCTTDEREKWEKYIKENDLDWINGWDPERRTNFGYYYNVEATPLLYILDRDKTIIAKKLSIDDVPSFIDNYRKYLAK